jgi:hypothetical protein
LGLSLDRRGEKTKGDTEDCKTLHDESPFPAATGSSQHLKFPDERQGKRP